QATTEAIAAAEKNTAKLPEGTRMRADGEKELAEQRAELGRKEQRREAFTAEVETAIADEIATEAKKHYREVLDEAAASAGFTVRDLGPYARDLAQRAPRFDKAFEPPVV